MHQVFRAKQEVAKLNLKTFNDAIAQFEHNMHQVLLHLGDVIKREQSGDVDQTARMVEELRWRAVKLVADAQDIKRIVCTHHKDNAAEA